MQWVPGALFLEVKRPVRETDHSPPGSAKVKNAWSMRSIALTSLSPGLPLSGGKMVDTCSRRIQTVGGGLREKKLHSLIGILKVCEEVQLE
jgi:hypothetical protein